MGPRRPRSQRLGPPSVSSAVDMSKSIGVLRAAFVISACRSRAVVVCVCPETTIRSMNETLIPCNTTLETSRVASGLAP